MIDFSLAKAQHQIWNLKLRLFLKGQQTLTEAEIVSHRDCKLGAWLYARALSKYSSILEMEDLEQVHAQLHESVKRVIQMKQRGNVAGARHELLKVDALTRQIVSLLNAIEAQVEIKKR